MRKKKNYVNQIQMSGTGGRGKVRLGRSKVVPVFFNSAPHNEGVLGDWRYSSTYSLTLALGGGGQLSEGRVKCVINNAVTFHHHKDRRSCISHTRH